MKYIPNKDGTSDLIVTEPWKDTNAFLSDGDAGAAYLWKGGSSFPSGVVKDPLSSSSSCFLSVDGKALFGYGFQVLDFNGDGELDVLLGGPRDRSLQLNGGSATLILSFS